MNACLLQSSSLHSALGSTRTGTPQECWVATLRKMATMRLKVRWALEPEVDLGDWVSFCHSVSKSPCLDMVLKQKHTTLVTLFLWQRMIRPWKSIFKDWGCWLVDHIASALLWNKTVFFLHLDSRGSLFPKSLITTLYSSHFHPYLLYPPFPPPSILRMYRVPHPKPLGISCTVPKYYNYNLCLWCNVMSSSTVNISHCSR